jgi:hypothetical protein
VKIHVFLGFLCALAAGCDNGELERAKAEAEKAKIEAELAKAKAEAETARAEAASERKVRELSEELAKKERESLAAGQASTQGLQKADPGNEAGSEGVEVSPKVTVSVAERKADGTPWDAMGGAPDLMVFVSGNQKSVQSGVATDRFNATLQLPPIKLKKGHVVQVVLVDKDMAQSDPIGSATVAFQGPGSSAKLPGLNGTIQF